MSDEMGIFEVIYNCRAMRRLQPDPVPEELLIKLVDAANQGPTGSNAQLGRWIVVRDPAQKGRLAELNKKAVNVYVGPNSGRPASLPHHSAEKRARMLKSVMWQAEHMQEIPALIIACAQFAAPVSRAESMAAGGSIWPAVQNLLLAARAVGLGAAPTTLGLADRPAAKHVLGLPDTIEPLCLIPVGYPLGKFGPVTRIPVQEIMRWDRWE